MANKFIINTKEVNYSLANPPKGWSVQNNINTDKYVCGLSECGNYLVRISEDGKIFINHLPFSSNVDNVKLTPCKVKLTSEYL